MKKSKLTDQQIAFAIKQAESGTPIQDVIRDAGHLLVPWRDDGSIAATSQVADVGLNWRCRCCECDR